MGKRQPIEKLVLTENHLALNDEFEKKSELFRAKKLNSGRLKVEMVEKDYTTKKVIYNKPRNGAFAQQFHDAVFSYVLDKYLPSRKFKPMREKVANLFINELDEIAWVIPDQKSRGFTVSKISETECDALMLDNFNVELKDKEIQTKSLKVCSVATIETYASSLPVWGSR